MSGIFGPRPSSTRAVWVHVNVPGASVRIERINPSFDQTVIADATGIAKLEQVPAFPGQAANVYLTATGYSGQTHIGWTILNGNQDLYFVMTAIPKPKLPPIPTREQVCGVYCTFQGFVAHTQQFGLVNWFEPWVAALDLPEDRQRLYKDKLEAGDRHQIIGFGKGGPIYDEPPFQHFIQPDFEANPDLFKARVLEIIMAGLTPIVTYDGDNGMDPVNGHPNAMRQLPILDALFKNHPDGDLRPYILFARFYDGVFYGATPEAIEEFGDAFRALNPNGYLAIEHNPGHIPVGEGGDDYKPGGRMRAYDVIASEFSDDPETDPYLGNDTIWQIVGRMITPYHRPADQVGDPTPPFYLVDSERGPRFYWAMEFGGKWGEYAWVRNRLSSADLQRHRQYFRDLGCKYVG